MPTFTLGHYIVGQRYMLCLTLLSYAGGNYYYIMCHLVYVILYMFYTTPHYLNAYNGLFILYVELYIGKLLYNMFTVSRYIVRRTHYVCRVLRAPKEYVFLIGPRDYFTTRCIELEWHL